MTALKIVDRIAVAALFTATVGGAILTLAPSHARAESAPAASIKLDGGGERRFYTTGPAGTRTYRVDISPSGQVGARTQVLRDEVFQGIHAGMLATDVLATIGPPSSKMRFEATKTTAWDYHYADLWSYDSDFSVIVDDAGVVVGKFSSRNGQ